jgi:hypothetical protein
VIIATVGGVRIMVTKANAALGANEDFSLAAMKLVTKKLNLF